MTRDSRTHVRRGQENLEGIDCEVSSGRASPWRSLGAGLAAFPGLRRDRQHRTRGRRQVARAEDEGRGHRLRHLHQGEGHRQGRLRPRRARTATCSPTRDGSARSRRPTPTSTSTPPRSAPTPGQLAAEPRSATRRAAAPSPTPSSTRASRSSARCCAPTSTSGGDLTSVNGFAAPDLSLSVDPRLSAKHAGDRAVAAVTADPPGHDGEKASARRHHGRSHRPDGLPHRRRPAARRGENVLAYVVEVTNDAQRPRHRVRRRQDRQARSTATR